MSSENPLISIVIPCHNVSHYIDKAVNSILRQSYKNLEICIIDDASSDDTLQKIKSFKDERIKVTALKENTQKVGAVNNVLKQVNGNYIAFQDADDWSELSRIGEQIQEFQKNPELGICFTNYRYVGDKKFLPKKISLTNEELKNEFLSFNLKGNKENSPTICGTMMISKAALEKTAGYHPYFSGRVAEDIHWIYRILKDFQGITIDKTLYNYRIREGSFTDTQSKGVKPKYAYSWHLLSKIIHKDIHEGIDALAPENKELLKELELQACEEALAEKISQLNLTIANYQNSASFRIGKLILSPIRLLKSIKKRQFVF